jgi:hypothetical protein
VQAQANGVEGTEMIGLHRRAVVAGNRNHRQPCLYARAVGRTRGPRRHDRLPDTGRAHEF